ncbi:hypothetical protein Tco_0668154 [Tanacetum coccineum]
MLMLRNNTLIKQNLPDPFCTPVYKKFAESSHATSGQFNWKALYAGLKQAPRAGYDELQILISKGLQIHQSPRGTIHTGDMVSQAVSGFDLTAFSEAASLPVALISQSTSGAEYSSWVNKLVS